MKKQLLLVCALTGSFISGAQAQTNSLVGLKEKTVNQKEVKVKYRPVSKSGTVIWGPGVPAGNTDGQFSSPFVQAVTYAPGDNPTMWTAVSVNQSSGATTPGNAYWTRSLSGYSQGAYVGTPTPIMSPSQSDGVAIFDSDYMDNGGVAGAFGTGSSPSQHRGDLISPRFDLTGYTDSALTVSFYSLFREFIISELSVGLSTDDGATWTTVDYRPFTASEVEEFVDVNFITATQGVANLTQCRLRFIFDGDYYFAMVDDISIKTAAEYDLTIGIGDVNGIGLQALGDQLHLTNNRYFPISQFANDFRHFSYGANVKNFGYVDLLPADNGRLIVTIEKDNAGTWSTVFTDSTMIDTVIAGGYTSLVDEITDYSWVSVGDHRVSYSVVFDGVDGNAANNTVEHFFTITPNDYASKVALNVNGTPETTRAITPGGGPYSAWEYGSVFYFDDATTANLMIDSVSFTYYLPNTFSPVNAGANQTVYARIYKVDPSLGIINDYSLLDQVGAGTITLNGLGTTIPVGSYGSAMCSNFVDVPSGGPLNTLTSGHYFVSFSINPSLSGGPATFAPNDVPWLGANEDKNYNFNVSLTVPDTLINLSPLSITNAGGGVDWYWTGFGADVVPSFGVYLSGDFCTSNGITVQPTDQNVNVGTNATFTVTTTVAGATYQWQTDTGSGYTNLTNGGQFSGVDSPTLTVSGVTLGNDNSLYRCLVTESANCEDTTNAATLTVYDAAVLNELDNSAAKIFPNPSNGIITILLDNQFGGKVVLTDVLGKEVLTHTFSSNETELDLSTLSSKGTYFVTILDANNNKVAIKKLIYQ